MNFRNIDFPVVQHKSTVGYPLKGCRALEARTSRGASESKTLRRISPCGEAMIARSILFLGLNRAFDARLRQKKDRRRGFRACDDHTWVRARDSLYFLRSTRSAFGLRARFGGGRGLSLVINSMRRFAPDHLSILLSEGAPQ